MKNSKSMRKNFNYEEDEMPEEIVKMNPVDLLDEILELEEQMPKDKRLSVYSEWKSKINEKMKTYNKLSGQKIFKLL